MTRPPAIILRGVKGGVGTSTVAATLALAAGRAGERALLVDASPGQDVCAVLGVGRPTRATPLDAGPGVTLVCLPGGRGLPDPYVEGFGVVVYDAGRLTDYVEGLPGRHNVASDPLTVNVGRNDYGSLHAWGDNRADVNVCVIEPGRALTLDDVVGVLPGGTVCPVDLSPAVARAVDAGILSSRLPSALVELAGQLMPYGVAS